MGTKGREPCSQDHLRRLATKPAEKCRLAQTPSTTETHHRYVVSDEWGLQRGGADE
jgi:hypothetical protein